MTNHVHSPALRLPHGEVIALPEHPNFPEFSLPGNFRGAEGASILAFYDPTTSTGALYYTGSRIWTTQQPVIREVFWLQYEVLASTSVGLATAETLTSELFSELGKKAAKAH